MTELKRPRVFISYSWTSPEYEEKITKFVNRLRDTGVDTVYDKYDLEVGASTHAFMEKSVTDDNIDKVLIFCDDKYVEKADARKGGAGTETLIISPKVYDDVDPAGKNKKFIPVIMERKENGKPCIPAYLDGRLYFDFSQYDEIDHDKFEELVRYLYNKPLLQAPGLGKPPSYVTEASTTYFGTTSKHNDAINALKAEKSASLAYCSDFFDSVYGALNGLFVEYDSDVNKVEEDVFNKINEMMLLRDECLDVINAMINYNYSDDMVEVIHKFLEGLLVYKNNRGNSGTFYEMQSDHFNFFIYELFTYIITILVTNSKFDKIVKLLHNYYHEDKFEGAKLRDFTVFLPSHQAFEAKNKRLNLNRISLLADTINERCNYGRIKFEALMQTELLLYMYSLLNKLNYGYHWYPDILIYSTRRFAPFELFMRATSKDFFKKSLGLLGIKESNFPELKEYWSKNSFGYGFHSVNFALLSNVDSIATTS